MTIPSHPDKLALRARMRAARNAHVADAANAVIPPPAGFADLVAGRRVAGYVAMPGEADPIALLDTARAAGAALLLPHISDRGAAMCFVALGDLARGPYGVMQPRRAEATDPPDIVLTPLIAVDARLMRLGQGGGHYDRALAMLPGAVAIGVAFAMQQVASLPIDPWDVPLSGLITETGMRWRNGIAA